MAFDGLETSLSKSLRSHCYAVLHLRYYTQQWSMLPTFRLPFSYQIDELGLKKIHFEWMNAKFCYRARFIVGQTSVIISTFISSSHIVFKASVNLFLSRSVSVRINQDVSLDSASHSWKLKIDWRRSAYGLQKLFDRKFSWQTVNSTCVGMNDMNFAHDACIRMHILQWHPCQDNRYDWSSSIASFWCWEVLVKLPWPWLLHIILMRWVVQWSPSCIQFTWTCV